MLYRDLVDIASFPSFHFNMENVVELVESHWRDMQWFITKKVKYVEVIQLTETVEGLVKAIIPLIGSPKVLGICSKTFQNIVATVGAHRSMENVCYSGDRVSTLSSHETKYFAPVRMVKMHQVIILTNVVKIIFTSSQVLKL